MPACKKKKRMMDGEKQKSSKAAKVGKKGWAQSTMCKRFWGSSSTLSSIF
jgi:hypothetical protein